MSDRRAGVCSIAAIISVMALILAWSAVAVHSQASAAANAQNFNASYIISDSRFYDSNAMTAAEVQTFLNKEVPVCHPEYDSDPSSIVCLKDYKTSSVSKTADSYCAGYSGGKTQTAAQIIDGVARSCGVSQEVLLVLLQKENGLVTHTWPSPWRYKTAMGYGCPDTAACDTQYYGFFNQVYNAARQYKLYKAKPASYQYRVGSNNIYWSPTLSCGSSTVVIRNQATAGLYNYTPYQPNQAALKAGYGTGNSCSSYGNRNFYLYYYDWFGDPTTESGIDLTSKSAVNVPNGQYYINAALAYTSGVDIPGGSKENKTQIQLYKANQSNAQRFQFNRQTDGSYEIVNVNSGKALDVYAAEASNGAVVDQYTRNGSSAQRWFIRQADGGAYYLQSALGNFALNLKDTTGSNGTAINISVPGAVRSQQFLLTSVVSVATDVSLRISSVINNSYVMDVSGGSSLNGAPVQIYPSNNSTAQRFLFKWISNGVYEIKNGSSGKLVEVAAGATQNKAPLQQYQSNGTQSQRWFVRDAGDGALSFYNLSSGKYIDIPSANVAPAQQLDIYTGNGTKAQQWKLAQADSDANQSTDITDGIYTIAAAGSSTSRVEIPGASTANYARAQLYTANGTKAQQWRVTHNAQGYLLLQNVASGKMLDVYSGKAVPSAPIDQYVSNGTTAQQWKAIKNSEGYITLVSAINQNYVLDARGGATGNGTPIVLYPKNETTAQQWSFIKQ